MKAERTRLSTEVITNKLMSIVPTDGAMMSPETAKIAVGCVRIMMDLASADSNPVVDGGALPALVALLHKCNIAGSPTGSATSSDNGNKALVDGYAERACDFATRAIFVINRGHRHQKAVVNAGAIEPLVCILKAESHQKKTNACRTLFRITHGMHVAAREASDAVLAAGAAYAIVSMMRYDTYTNVNAYVRHAAIKAAASLACSMASNASLGCEEFKNARMADTLMALLTTGDCKEDAQAYAAQALVDITNRQDTLRTIVAPIFCTYIDDGKRQIDWFDVASGLGATMWRARQIDDDLARLVARPLVDALNDGFATRGAENCVVMAIANIGGTVPTHFSAIVERLVLALEIVGQCAATKIRIVRTIAAITHKSNMNAASLSFSTGLATLQDALVRRMLPHLTQLLSTGSNVAKKHTADCIGCIANELGYVQAVVTAGAFAPLMASLLSDQCDEATKQFAVMALGNISFLSGQAQHLLKLGGLPPLVKLLKTDCALQGGEFAAMAIASMALDVVCADVMLKAGVAIILVRLVDKYVTPSPAANSKEKLLFFAQEFTQAWAVVGLLSFGGTKYTTLKVEKQNVEKALQSFVAKLGNQSESMKSDLAKALLETIAKVTSRANHHSSNLHVLEHKMTTSILEALAVRAHTNDCALAKRRVAIANAALAKLRSLDCK